LTEKYHTREEEYWLALIRAPKVGPITFLRFIDYFGSPRNVFEADRTTWHEVGIKNELLDYLQNPDWSAVEKDLEWLSQADNHLLTLEHPGYPPRLREIHDPPPILFVRGNYKLLTSTQVALVGTREPSPSGESIAADLAKRLVGAGFTITSGMALGIDAASHRATLAEAGHTIAVLGTGVDRVYPRQHYELAHEISEKGALVSEFLLGMSAKAAHFPRRNRVISGLSLGTVVVEASLSSGALITAHQAIEQGREVFAIPGSIYSPWSKGCHKLIKEGAKLIETADDIIEELIAYISPLAHYSKTTTVPFVSASPVEKKEELDADYLQLLACLGTKPTSVDHLVEQSGLTAGMVSSMLLILEMNGLVASQTGGLYVRTG